VFICIEYLDCVCLPFICHYPFISAVSVYLSGFAALWLAIAYLLPARGKEEMNKFSSLSCILSDRSVVNIAYHMFNMVLIKVPCLSSEGGISSEFGQGRI
jgi:hypothetical protein